MGKFFNVGQNVPTILCHIIPLFMFLGKHLYLTMYNLCSRKFLVVIKFLKMDELFSR